MLIREKKSRKPTRLLKQWSRKSRRIVCSRSDRPNCSPDRHASITHLKNCGKCSGAFLKTWTGMNNRVSMHLHRRSAQTFHLMKYSKIYYWFKSCTGIHVEICSHTESTLFVLFFPFTLLSLLNQHITQTSQAGTFSRNFSLIIQQIDIRKLFVDDLGV